MSLSKPRDGRLVAASTEYRDLRSSLCHGEAGSLNQIAPDWPEFSAYFDFRGKKHGVARELANAELCEGSIKCFTAILPRRPIAAKTPFAKVRFDRPCDSDFVAIAKVVEAGLPEETSLDRLNVYVVEDYSVSIHHHFEFSSKIVRGSTLPRCQIGWFLQSSPLACLISLREIYLRVRETREMSPSVFSRLTAPGLEIDYPRESDAHKGRPFAILGTLPTKTVCVIGAGLNADELKNHCEEVSRLLLPSFTNRYAEKVVESMTIEIW